MNRPHPPAPSPKRGEGGQDLAFKVPLPLWERDLGRGNDIRARGLFNEFAFLDRRSQLGWDAQKKRRALSLSKCGLALKTIKAIYSSPNRYSLDGFRIISSVSIVLRILRNFAQSLGYRNQP
jgi:hypothetical protein